MNNHIYADNAATTKLDKKAFEAMIPWLTEEYANPSQPYSFSRQAKKALADARATIAACINADPDEIFFTSGGTESDNWALKGVLWNKPLTCKILTSEFEHHAVLNSCNSLKAFGYGINYIKPSKEGYIVPEVFEKAISSDIILASIMMVNNELGTIQPIKDLCNIAHNHGLLFHSDAVQALGHIKIDVKELGVDLLSGSAHKFNGPKGIGFLYIKKGTILHPFLDGGAQENLMRAGTENVASIVGMAVALKENCIKLNDNQILLSQLENRLINGLEKKHIPFVFNGGNKKIPGLVSISFAGKDGEAILHRLDLMGIEVSTGAACDSVKTEISHVLKAIGLSDDLAYGTIRISLGKHNTNEDVDTIIDGLSKILL